MRRTDHRGLSALLLCALLMGRVCAADPPGITGVVPDAGLSGGGAQVVITGNSFTGTTAVMFGGVAATAFSVDSDTQITAQSPPGVLGGVDITVIAPAGMSAVVPADVFTYAPAITVMADGFESGLAGWTVTDVRGTSGSWTVSAAEAFDGAYSADFNAIFAYPGNSARLSWHAPIHIPDTATAAALTFWLLLREEDWVTTAAVLQPQVSTDEGLTWSAVGPPFARAGSAWPPYLWVSRVVDLTAYIGLDIHMGLLCTSDWQDYVTVDDVRIVAIGDAPPMVSGLSPLSGSDAGGTTVVISGGNFTAARVTIGGVVAPVQMVGLDSITVTTPALPAGTWPVVVSTPSGTDASANYTALAVPSITQVSPASGPIAGGTTLTITGTHLGEVTGLAFGGVAAARYVVDSPTRITAVTPAGTGMVHVTATSGIGSSEPRSSDEFFFAPPPTVTGLSPSKGPVIGGSTVVVQGAYLTDVTSVTLAGQQVPFIRGAYSEIKLLTPPGTGDAHIQVTTTMGVSNTDVVFTYDAVPEIRGFSPRNGPCGAHAVVSITGVDFTDATAVLFDGIPADRFTVNSDVSITAVTPIVASAHRGAISVVTPVGTARSSEWFWFHRADGYADGIYDLTDLGDAGSADLCHARLGDKFQVENWTFMDRHDGLSGGYDDPTPFTAVIRANGTTCDTFTFRDLRISLAPARSLASCRLVLRDRQGVQIGSTIELGPSPESSIMDPVSLSDLYGIPPWSIDQVSEVEIAYAVVWYHDVPLSPADAPLTSISLANVASSPGAPLVQHVTPDSAFPPGGSAIVITGHGFSGATAVLFGTMAATSFTVDSPTQITAICPAAIDGTVVQVSVTTPLGTSPAGDPGRFSYAPTTGTGFERSDPGLGGWHASAGTWQVVAGGDTCRPHGGSRMMKFCSHDLFPGAADDMRLQNGLKLSIPDAAQTAVVSFWMFQDDAYAAADDRIQIQVSVDGTTWSDVGAAAHRHAAVSGWTRVSADVSAYRGRQVQVGLQGISAAGGDIFVDDLEVQVQAATPATPGHQDPACGIGGGLGLLLAVLLSVRCRVVRRR